MLGFSVEELLSLTPKAMKALLHPDDREQLFHDYRSRIAGEQVPPRFNFRRLRKDGSTAWVEIVPARISYHGRPAVQATFIDITERIQAEEKLKTICRDLHDNIIQTLYALGMKLESYREQLPVGDERMRRLITGQVNDVNTIIDETREFVAWILDPAGQSGNAANMIAAAKAMVKRFSVSPGLKIQLNFNPQACLALDDLQKRHVLAILREALSNAVRHAGARHIGISLMAQKRNIVLEVRDDGNGFRHVAHKAWGGIRHVRERARAMKAKDTIDSAPGRGTRIRVEIPLKNRSGGTTGPDERSASRGPRGLAQRQSGGPGGRIKLNCPFPHSAARSQGGA